MPEIKNKDGSVSAWGLACGHQEIDTRCGIRVRMYQEHGAYHVRAHDANTSERIVWEVFTYCKDARAYYNRLLSAAASGRILELVHR